MAKKEEKKVPLIQVPRTGLPTPKSALRLPASGDKMSVVERLRGMKKQDLVGLATGLSVLILTPLATHFMTQPRKDPFLLEKGTTLRDSVKNGAALFEGEHGETAPGGPLGGPMGQVITPLSAHDPASLVLAPGRKSAADKPQVRSADAGAKLRDAMSAATKAATRQAVKSAGAPKPSASQSVNIPKIAGQLSGLGAANGGSGAKTSLGNGSILASAANAPSKAAGRNAPAPRGGKGFRGVAATPNRIDGNAGDLKDQAAKAAGAFNREGAVAAIEEAARQSIGAGGGSGYGGGPHDGKNTGHHGGKFGGKYSFGESLAFIEAKTRMMKELEMEYANKKFWEVDVKQMLAKSVIENVFGEGIIKPIGKTVGGWVAGPSAPPTVYVCLDANGNVLKSTTDEKVVDSWNGNLAAICPGGVDIADGSTPAAGTTGEGREAGDTRPAYVRNYENFSGTGGSLGDAASLRSELDASIAMTTTDMAAARELAARKHEQIREYAESFLAQVGAFENTAREARERFNPSMDTFFAQRLEADQVAAGEIAEAKTAVDAALAKAIEDGSDLAGRQAILSWAMLVRAGGQGGQPIPETVHQVNDGLSPKLDLSHVLGADGNVSNGYMGTVTAAIANAPARTEIVIGKVDGSAANLHRRLVPGVRDTLARSMGAIQEADGYLAGENGGEAAREALGRAHEQIVTAYEDLLAMKGADTLLRMDKIADEPTLDAFQQAGDRPTMALTQAGLLKTHSDLHRLGSVNNVVAAELVHAKDMAAQAKAKAEQAVTGVTQTAQGPRDDAAAGSED